MKCDAPADSGCTVRDSPSACANHADSAHSLETHLQDFDADCSTSEEDGDVLGFARQSVACHTHQSFALRPPGHSATTRQDGRRRHTLDSPFSRLFSGLAIPYTYMRTLRLDSSRVASFALATLDLGTTLLLMPSKTLLMKAPSCSACPVFSPPSQALAPRLPTTLPSKRNPVPNGSFLGRLEQGF